MRDDTQSVRQVGSSVDAAPTAAAERRRTPRVPVDRAVSLRLTDSGNLPAIAARLVDLSASGIGVRLQRPLAPGKHFILEVGTGGGIATNLPGGESVFSLRYVVVRCKPLGQGAFHIGAAFVRTPAPSSSAKANNRRA